MDKYIVFDVGGTKVKHGVIFENGTFVEKDKYDTNCTNYEVFIEEMVNVIDDYKYSHDIKGIGISVPGFINVNTGYAERAGALTSLDGKNLKEIIENNTKIKVEIENDANCVALAEKLNGNASNCKDYICYTIGTGIGGGIVINDKIVHGHKFMAGEFGFMKIDRESDDNLHLNSSTGALINMYRELKSFEKDSIIDGNQIFEKALMEEDVKILVERWYKNIATSMFNLCVTLNPEKILIGGGVSERKDLLENINKYLENFKEWHEFETKVEICKHKNDAGMVGALYNFLSKN